LLKKLSTFLTYIDLSIIFFNLNHCFLANSELKRTNIQEEVTVEALLDSRATGLVISQIFTVTSLSISLLSRLQQDLLSIILKSIANLSVLEPNQEPLDFISHLNYYSYCLNCSYTLTSFFVLLFPNLYSFLQYDQNFYNYSNSFLYLYLWYMYCV